MPMGPNHERRTDLYEKTKRVVTSQAADSYSHPGQSAHDVAHWMHQNGQLSAPWNAGAYKAVVWSGKNRTEHDVATPAVQHGKHGVMLSAGAGTLQFHPNESIDELSYHERPGMPIASERYADYHRQQEKTKHL